MLPKDWGGRQSKGKVAREEGAEGGKEQRPCLEVLLLRRDQVGSMQAACACAVMGSDRNCAKCVTTSAVQRG